MRYFLGVLLMVAVHLDFAWTVQVEDPTKSIEADQQIIKNAEMNYGKKFQVDSAVFSVGSVVMFNNRYSILIDYKKNDQNAHVFYLRPLHTKKIVPLQQTSLEFIHFYEINLESELKPRSFISFQGEPQGVLKSYKKSENRYFLELDRKVLEVPSLLMVDIQTAAIELNRIKLEYPEEALKHKIRGSVVVDVSINKEGEVEDATIFSGHPLLNSAALKNVKQIRYEPAKLNGIPIPIRIRKTLRYDLQNG